MPVKKKNVARKVTFAAKARRAIIAALENAGPRGLPFAKLRIAVQKEYPKESIYNDSEKTTSNIASAVNALKRAGDVAKVSPSKMSEDGRVEKKTRWALSRHQNDDKISARVAEQGFSPDRSRESHFYAPTVTAALGQDILTAATVIGGALTNWAYGTPDIVGIIQPSSLVRPLSLPSEVVAIEIKHGTKLHSLVTGLAQAIRYKRFAHRGYLVVHPHGEGKIPNWLEGQCRHSGVGLCELDADEATLRIIADAPSNTPDLRLLSEFIRKLPKNKRGDLRLN